MTNPKKPLTPSQKREIWVSFWLHSIVAAVFGTLGIVAANLGYIAELHPVLKSIILGVPNFLVWARFVTKIRKYHESTGIPYPSTYFALAIGSGVLVIGPLLMFLLLLIRMFRVPTLEDHTQDNGYRKITPARQHHHPNAVYVPMPSLPAAHQAFVETGNQPPESDEDVFYEEVARELESGEKKPGVWARALAEADGKHDLTQAKYIRLRVAQLTKGKAEQVAELERMAAEQAEHDAHILAEQKERAAKEAELQEVILAEQVRSADQQMHLADQQKPVSFAEKMRAEAVMAQLIRSSVENEAMQEEPPKKGEMHPLVILLLIASIIFALAAMFL